MKVRNTFWHSHNLKPYKVIYPTKYFDITGISKGSTVLKRCACGEFEAKIDFLGEVKIVDGFLIFPY